MIKKNIITHCLMLSVIIILVFAHNPEVIKLEGNLVKFQFDTGDTMYGARLIVEDAKGESLYRSFVKEDGIFDYTEYIGTAVRIVVNDGGGHLVEYDIPQVNEQSEVEQETSNAQLATTQTALEQNNQNDEPPLQKNYTPFIIGGGIVIVIGSIYYYISKK